MLLILAGCSDAGINNPNDPTGPPDNSTDDLLKTMAFTGNVLNVETRLVSYSKKAGQVSIIDPVLEKEIWRKTATGFEFAIALPDFSGAALFNSGNITIMTQNAEKGFVLGTEYSHLSIARKTAAYSFASRDGTTVEVIRSLGAGMWQQETLSIPWGAIDPKITQAPENEPVLLASSFNDAGTVLTVFAPADGRYAVFNAASIAEPLMATDAWCVGYTTGTPINARFSSLRWDETRQIFFAGTSSGQIIAINPTAGACSPLGSLPTIDLGTLVPVNHLSVFPSGTIGVIQDMLNQAGSIVTIDFDGTDFSPTPLVYKDICEAPLDLMEISGNYIVVMCTYESVIKNPSDTTPAPSQTSIDPRLYVTLDKITGEIVNRVTIDGVASASVAVDPVSQMLFRMQEGAFGTLEIINLVTGARRKHVGIYLENILN